MSQLDSMKTIQQAAIELDFQGVAAALHAGQSINSKNEHGETPLLALCARYVFASVKTQQERMIRQQDGSDRSERNAEMEMIHYLLQCGADIYEALPRDHPRAMGCTALHCAANDPICDPRLVPLLSDFGADIEAMDAFGKTAIQLAARAGNTSLVSYLLSRGAKSDKTVESFLNSRAEVKDQISAIDPGGDLRICRANLPTSGDVTDILHAICEPIEVAYHTTSNFAKINLSPGQKMLYSTYYLDTEIPNGGFQQLFFNSSGDFVLEALSGLKLLGLKEHFNILREAVTAFGQRAYPINRQIRWQRMEEIKNSAVPLWDALDSRWYELDSLEKHWERYIHEHPKDFFLD